ncbi:L-fuculose-phosphate aldolase [Amycolatopsis mediterranei S699]|uniref:L-fuculose-phosphate aldolase n=3 Tax=Amycolatopsis mediterranei TaxID=33910 RepID=A0A0H3D6Z9_AMYMU|nr:L-fuculose-phosphate aldolase [Amycolatopsis mediterranei U32]AEK42029.1 L-fuculose-phosphate aldolase [Amycolatopsis mediterranei S699]AFO76980.1 L-fuculose-phosphate aldolase [Amycolatopsis mediterranei S699]AGT84108.1 L-fuculose-phosphate aldolase [Amycolatopsis mediterranei RB]
MLLQAARQAVVAACHDLAGAGLLIGTAGNVSVRVGEHVAVTATGAVLGRITPAQITVVDLAGTVVAGELAPTSELELHLGIYRRSGAGAVVHTHSPQATAVSCALDELPCVHYQQLLLGGAVRVAPFAVFGSDELAEHVWTALEGKSAALLANHGAVVHGPTLQAAVDNALLLEWACELYRNAASIGTPRVLDTAQQAAVIEAALRRGYGSTRRIEEDL